MKELIGRGPITIVLIYSPQCPHCHTYMPLWKRLCKQSDRRANLVHMETPVYSQLELSEKKSIDGVPTVLFVDKEGNVKEAESPRDERVMSNAVRMGVSEKEATEASADESDNFTPVSTATVPGVTMSESELPAIPGTVIPSPTEQSGGSPWAAFLMTARQAAPAATLLGAYSLLRKPVARSSGLGKPVSRSSGLGKPVSRSSGSRKTRRRRSRRKSQQRRH